MAGIQAIRTSTIIDYALNNYDKHYISFAIRISKYVKHGFKLLTPLDFNMRRFEAIPMHISNQDLRVDLERTSDNEQWSHIEVSFNEYNYEHDYGLRNLVFSRNYDCFHVQEKFYSKILFGS
ncbi:unnamed protein product [Rotaria socialis]|nr:unnamed protein product [Rotaria socialis]